LQNTQKVLLPFVSSQQPDRIITDETEKAAIFCLAELDRGKGSGGLFRKREMEKIVFITKTFYPFWVVPLRDLTLLFDGLNVASQTVAHPSFPDTKTFMDDLNQRSSTRQMYATFLSNHLNYFENSDREQTKIVEGLISDLDFLSEFLEYCKEAIATDNPADGVLVSPALEKNQIEENLRDLENLHQKLEHELEELNGVIKALNKQTQQALTALREEIKATEGKFEPQIEEAKAELEERRSNINKEYSDKVTQASDKYEQELIAMRKKIITLQKTNEQTNSEIINAENEIKTATINKDDEAEQKWKYKRNELKKHLPEVTAIIKNLEIKVQETEENKKKTMFQLKQENDAAMKEAGKYLIEIESSRDAEIKICQGEMEKIEDSTSTIIGKIDKLTKISESAINEFQNLGIRLERVSGSLVYMPFYLISYQTGSNKRCISWAPSVANSISIGAKFRALGKSKITQLFQPRSQRIISKINIFLTILDENIAFSHEINDACSKANLLGSKEKVELIKNGLSQLTTDGWLSDGEFESFSQALS
jgi:hypothetical protein